MTNESGGKYVLTPWSYQKRVEDAQVVAQEKRKLNMSDGNPTKSQRSNVSKFLRIFRKLYTIRKTATVLAQEGY